MSRSVLIADDEALARARLQRLVNELENFTVAGEAENGQAAVDKARELSIDIVLMDIRMPVMDGLQAAKALLELPVPPAVIFCTAYDEYALPAFEASATGYLLKPVPFDQLQEALCRAVQLTQAQLTALSELGKTQAQRYLHARSSRGVQRVPVESVRCLLADSKYVTIVHGGGEALTDKTLRELEVDFDGSFLRIHRNALVSVAHIEALERAGGGHYCVRLSRVSVKPRVSRRHLAAVRRALM